MAQYKVPQDVEADDKLLGPFTFRQFVYLLIAGGLIALAVGLFQLHPLLAILPVPPTLLLLALSLPLKKDQPMETYLAALITFYIKPRKKLWVAGQPESTILITAPKVKVENRTRDISGEEAAHRLSFLANIVDSEGRAISSINSSVMRDDLAAEANSVADIFEENGQFNNIDTILQKDENARHAEVMENMRKAIAASETPFTAAPSTSTQGAAPTITRDFNASEYRIPAAPAPAVPMNNPAAQAAPAVQAAPAPAPVAPNIAPTIEPPAMGKPYNPAAAAAPPVDGPDFSSPVVVLPNSPIKKEERIPVPKPDDDEPNEPVYVKNSNKSPKEQAMIDLASTTDLPVSSIAKEAKRIKGKEDSEVFISLH